MTIFVQKSRKFCENALLEKIQTQFLAAIIAELEPKPKLRLTQILTPYVRQSPRNRSGKRRYFSAMHTSVFAGERVNADIF
jgi:hypothetical protein